MDEKTNYIKPKAAKKIAYCTYHSCIITAVMAKKHGCYGWKPRCRHLVYILGGGDKSDGKSTD